MPPPHLRRPRPPARCGSGPAPGREPPPRTRRRLTGVLAPPFAPRSMLTRAAGPLGISMGTVNGDIRRIPARSKMSSCPSVVRTPPVPVPMTTASRTGSARGAPASCQASRALRTATCSPRSSFLASTLGSSEAGSTVSPAATCTGRSAAHSSSRKRTPDLPSSSPDHDDGASAPNGVIAPTPVTTTRPFPDTRASLNCADAT